MTGESREFQTTDGVVRIDHDTVQVRSTVRQFLAGKRRGAVRSLGVVFGLALLASLGYNVYRLLDVSLAGVSLVTVFSLLGTLYGLWYGHLRQETIPLSALERVSVDESNRELTLRYDAGEAHSRVFVWLHDWTPGRKTLTIPTDEELREVRETFRLRGIAVEDATEQSVKTIRRFVVRDGVYFCESCDGQVSPTDSECPSCGYGLRVDADATAEQPVTASESV